MPANIKDTITPALRKLIIKSGRPREILSGMGATLASITGGNFTNPAMRPKPWKPHKRPLGNQLLVKKGLLRTGIKVSRVTARKVTVSSDRKYAPYHQFGTKHIPARPYFPFNGKTMTENAKAAIQKDAEIKMRKIARDSGAL